MPMISLYLDDSIDEILALKAKQAGLPKYKFITRLIAAGIAGVQASTVDRERATSGAGTVIDERATRSESTVGAERAASTKRTKDRERAGSGTSTAFYERAAVPAESAKDQERADRSVSTVHAERAIDRESTDNQDRAEVNESTVDAEFNFMGGSFGTSRPAPKIVKAKR